MDRCPLCKGQTHFNGISIRPGWLKWMLCSVCGTYSACNEFGVPQFQTKKIAPDYYFVTFREKS